MRLRNLIQNLSKNVKMLEAVCAENILYGSKENAKIHQEKQQSYRNNNLHGKVHSVIKIVRKANYFIAEWTFPCME